MSEQDEDHPHRILQRWVSLGDILVLVSALIVFAFGYGRLSRDVEALTRAVMELQSRDITPGAASAIASINATINAQENQIERTRMDSMEFRREVRESLARIEAKLDSHANPR